jgi:hypothetical protein
MDRNLRNIKSLTLEDDQVVNNNVQVGGKGTITLGSNVDILSLTIPNKDIIGRMRLQYMIVTDYKQKMRGGELLLSFFRESTIAPGGNSPNISIISDAYTDTPVGIGNETLTHTFGIGDLSTPEPGDYIANIFVNATSDNGTNMNINYTLNTNYGTHDNTGTIVLGIDQL